MMRLIFPLLFLFSALTAFTQDVECFAFYNLENLFDIEDDTLINDAEYLPSAGWTEEKYLKKLDRMAEILSELGKDHNINGPAFIGVSEIENRKVLQDLVNHPLMIDHGYQILHIDGPDRRGVDVAALYKANRFTPLQIKNIPVHITNSDGSRKFTRDVLLVKGLIGGEIVTITVNHWPSRYGGRASIPSRNAVAQLNRQLLDSLVASDPSTNFILMGDLNDDPTNESVADILNAQRKEKSGSADFLYNPFCALYKKGIGSNAWRDAWHNFDQIIINGRLTNKGLSKWVIDNVQIYKRQKMLQPSGRYKGYPFRTKAGGQYMGGYSDHFPVLLYLKKRT